MYEITYITFLSSLLTFIGEEIRKSIFTTYIYIYLYIYMYYM